MALNGPANPLEYADLRSTRDVLQPDAEATGGAVLRVGPDATRIPDLRRVDARERAAGSDWIGLRERGAYAVRSSRSRLLMPGLPAATLFILLALIAWRREGR